MKGVVCTRYGPPEVLQLEDVAKPVPGKKQSFGTCSTDEPVNDLVTLGLADQD